MGLFKMSLGKKAAGAAGDFAKTMITDPEAGEEMLAKAKVAGNIAKREATAGAEAVKKSRAEKKAEKRKAKRKAARAKAKEKRNKELRKTFDDYFANHCDGECETCDYYDVCDSDVDEEATAAMEAERAEAAAEEEKAAAIAAAEEYYEAGCDGECDDCPHFEFCPAEEEEDEEDDDLEFVDDDDDDEEEDEDEELTPEELAAYEAAEAYYEAGCDGECDDCPHYDYCPADEEDEADSKPKDKVVLGGIKESDLKEAGKAGVGVARETYQAVSEVKGVVDEFNSMLDFKSLFK